MVIGGAVNIAYSFDTGASQLRVSVGEHDIGRVPVGTARTISRAMDAGYEVQAFIAELVPTSAMPNPVIEANLIAPGDAPSLDHRWSYSTAMALTDNHIVEAERYDAVKVVLTVIAAIILVVLGFVIAVAKHQLKSVSVHGYTRKDGSSVGSYYRSH